LQHLLRILKKVLELFRLPAKHLRRQLCRHLDPSNGTVFGHESNFVDLDARIACQRRFQLLRQRTRLRIPAGKCAHKFRETRLCGVWCEVDAGDSGGRQQLRETLFGCGSPQRNPVQQKLCA
jgi:hypothetical protein